MELKCPYCGHDHAQEVEKEPDAWIEPEGPYETECLKCGENFVVHTHVEYSFSTSKISYRGEREE